MIESKRKRKWWSPKISFKTRASPYKQFPSCSFILRPSHIYKCQSNDASNSSRPGEPEQATKEARGTLTSHQREILQISLQNPTKPSASYIDHLTWHIRGTPRLSCLPKEFRHKQSLSRADLDFLMALMCVEVIFDWQENCFRKQHLKSFLISQT